MATALSEKPMASSDGDAAHDAAAIALHDGRCGLCNNLLQFSSKRARPGAIRFLALQSELGEQLQAEHGIDAQQLDSMILIEDRKAFTRSDASLRLLKYLRQPWPMLRVLLLVPRPIRNWVYDWIARNRIRWFGKCELPAGTNNTSTKSQ